MAHTQALLPPVMVTDLGAKGIVELRPGAVVTPLAEVVRACAPGRPIAGRSGASGIAGSEAGRWGRYNGRSRVSPASPWSAPARRAAVLASR